MKKFGRILKSLEKSGVYETRVNDVAMRRCDDARAFMPEKSWRCAFTNNYVALS